MIRRKYTIEIDIDHLVFEGLETEEGIRNALEFEINSLYMEGIDGLACEPRPIRGVAMSNEVVGTAFIQEDYDD